jgi:hypothetical protein
MTTKLLDTLFEKVSAMDPEVQDQLAKQWLEELEDEAKWDETFASPKSQQLLEKLAKKALEDHREGKTIAKGWDEL